MFSASFLGVCTKRGHGTKTVARGYSEPQRQFQLHLAQGLTHSCSSVFSCKVGLSVWRERRDREVRVCGQRVGGGRVTVATLPFLDFCMGVGGRRFRLRVHCARSYSKSGKWGSHSGHKSGWPGTKPMKQRPMCSGSGPSLEMLKRSGREETKSFRKKTYEIFL